MSHEQSEREAFEAWNRSDAQRGMPPINIELSIPGSLQAAVDEIGWRAWQARAAHPVEPPRTVTGDGAGESDALLAAALEVEAWWLREKVGETLGGAPAGIFMLRAAIAALKGRDAEHEPAPTRPYYLGGPYHDGSFSVCELATGRVLRLFRTEEDLIGPQRYKWSHVGFERFRMVAASAAEADADLPGAAALTDEQIDVARFQAAPCYLCGYNGAGYFQPTTHNCVAKYHAVLAAAKP